MNYLPALSWLGMLYGIVILLMIICLVLLWVWPRNQNGHLYSFEEFTELVNNMPKSTDVDHSRARKVVLMFLLIIVSFGVALSQHVKKTEALDD